MSRGRLIALLLLALIALLFLGRWTVVLLSEGWWAEILSPAAARALGQMRLLKALLDAAGVTIASLWFTGNLYTVYRAIGSVQVPRRLANLEIHEAMTPRMLLGITLGFGVFLGFLAGTGLSHWWPNVLLAWHGVTYGITDPVLGHDLGLYLAQLPLWRRLHGFALLLVLLGLGLCLTLYVLVGAIRWSGRRPALSNHVRRHAGWLLAATALVIGWGYWLEPYEMVAGLGGPIRADATQVRVTVSLALMGVALSTALLSAWWAIRPRHGWVAGGWLVLVLASGLGHYVVPALAGAPEQALLDDEGLRRMEAMSFGLNRLDEISPTMMNPGGGTPGPVSLWSERQIGELGEGDSSVAVAANEAVLRNRGVRLPVWISLRLEPSDSLSVVAYAADRTTRIGGPVSYRAGDSLAYPGGVRFLALPRAAVRPEAPENALTQEPTGVPVGGWGRRLVLAWARQSGTVLKPLPDSTRMAWHLDPVERLTALMPHATWGTPSAVLIGGELYWLAFGYVVSNTFPMVDRVPWREREVTALEVPFVAVIQAESGATRIFRFPGTGPLGKAWQDLVGAAAEPWASLPGAMATHIGYPQELFEVQARVLERSHWLGLRQVSRAQPGSGPLVRPTLWLSSDTSLQMVAAFEAPGNRGITALVLGRTGERGRRLSLIRFSGTSLLASPTALLRSWNRFATYEQLEDSLRSAGAVAETAPLGLWLGNHGLGAYQSVFGVGPERQVSVAWVNLALGDSLGAGRDLQEAWQNLLGHTAPLVASQPGGRLAEAERWMLIADSALRTGDWTTFGRAFEALRQVLSHEP